MVSLNFKATGILTSGLEVEFGILKNKHLAELTKKRKKSDQAVLIDVVSEVTTRIGNTSRVTSETIGKLTPIDFKQLLCLIRQNTFDYPEEIEQTLSYEEIGENGKGTGNFLEYALKEKITDGEFGFELGTLAKANGFVDKNNTVLKTVEEYERKYVVTIPKTKRREEVSIRMTAPFLSRYIKVTDEDVITMIKQRKPEVKNEKGWLRLNVDDLPMPTASFLLAEIEKAEGKVHTQTKFTHPQTGEISVIDFTNYPEFLLGKS